MLNQQCAILTCIDSHIKPLLIRVLSTDKFGVCRGTIEVDSISSSCGKEEGDRFKLSIPYARQNLTWNVFFDSQCPEIGPDFIFNDYTFLADVDVDTLSTKVPSLAKWNPNDRNALLNVLIELLSCYKQHQIQLLQKQDRLQLEYDTLENSTEVKPKDVEIILLPFGSKPTEARFLISLSVDVSQLQICTCESENVAMLLVIFSGSDWNRIIPQLYFSKSLEDALEGTTALTLPHFPADEVLIDYVSEVRRCITKKINSIVQNLKKRREFITALLAQQYASTIEYDAVKYTYITNLFNEQDFYFILLVKLPPGFPWEQPVVTLQSIYHMTSPFVPYSEVVENVPYDPRWEPFTMVIKLLEYIKRNIKKFQSNSIRNCF